ncbi:hypothetical protein I3249_06350 [Psychrobacter sp. Ps1]|uniref:hypothetical protein n=1 Tax=Gammaproteobacteria TaxID=1236 RepID=UPI001EDDB422|nr:hypothetical protein [Psychrobacter sp. Ps1]MCG3842395.1 hypothetical protein [Psychrobacter sp. Ps1]
MKTKIYAFDESLYNPKLIEALKNNQAIFRDGVAYWKKGLKTSGIIQHIPLKEVSAVTSETFVKTLGSLQSTLQGTIVAAQAVSSATLMIAVVVQTQILSKKIEAVRSSVLQVSQNVNEQNILFYTDKASEYLSVVHNLKLILESNEDIQVIESLANTTLANSMQLKSHLSFFILNLLNLIKSEQIQDKQHAGLVLNFIQQMMEVLPVGMHLEHLVSHRLGQYELSQTLIKDSHNKYSILLENYRGYLNTTNNRMKLSQAEAENLSYFNKIKQPALNLISNQIHVELLEKPAHEQLSIMKCA